jgi:2-polyprenyl-3-methyl-5-hydroxy-6-metoxy-1,4-benzoquinol methylase
MFQFPRLDARALRALGPRPATPDDMDALARLVDARIDALRAHRVAEARRAGGLAHLHAALDRAIRTDAPEHLDERDYPAAKKVRIVAALHRLNRVTLAYRRFTRALRPWIERAAAVQGRPARLLELASGSGEFTLALAETARRAGLAVEITGSDYVPEYVTRAREKARARGLDVGFEVLDAFDMAGCAADRWDVVFIGQSAHHFTAGQLAKMIAQSRRIATTAFVAVDGRRSLKLLAFVPLSAAFTLERGLVHDGAITARKFFAESELAEIAAMAAPDAAVTVAHHRPGYSVLTAAWG